MRKAKLWGLLGMLFVSELQAAAGQAEEKKILTEGETLNYHCVYTRKHSQSQKAWQRVMDGGKAETLAFTEKTSKNSQELGGRYFLEDNTTQGAVHVRMTNVQVSDSGLYRCVIYPILSNPEVLESLRLVVTKGPSASTSRDKNPPRDKAQTPTFPPATKAPVTQPPPKSTAGVSRPGLEVNPTNVTDVTRISVFSIVIPVACALVTKSLVLTVLFAVTQKSFGS
ncbi:triggering receptor expressed on myeloid cells 1 [Equus asinus]|uniref:Triggering receptor expressed on myeloid cells 1 n=1 Tax=Equus asinus TaxID=9793 RepID=A0A8C4L0F4_EQUAS|nr:triggering receptor expressed on myeloid cells 1 [Equus asinus]